MKKLVEDVSNLIKRESNSLTTKDLEKLGKLVEFVIIDDVVDAKLKGEDVTEIDLGLGTLYIKCDGDDVKTKLVLNDDFKNRIIASTKVEQSALDAKLNEALVTRIIHIYKDLIQ